MSTKNEVTTKKVDDSAMDILHSQWKNEKLTLVQLEKDQEKDQSLLGEISFRILSRFRFIQVEELWKKKAGYSKKEFKEYLEDRWNLRWGTYMNMWVMANKHNKEDFDMIGANRLKMIESAKKPDKVIKKLKTIGKRMGHVPVSKFNEIINDEEIGRPPKKKSKPKKWNWKERLQGYVHSFACPHCRKKIIVG